MSLRTDLELGKCEGLTVKEMVRKYNVPQSGVRYQIGALEKAGVEVKYQQEREKMDKASKAKMMEDIRSGTLNGITKKKIAERYGCTENTVKHAFREVREGGYDVYCGSRNKKTDKDKENEQDKKQKQHSTEDAKKYNRCWECIYWAKMCQCCDYLLTVGHMRPRRGKKCYGKVKVKRG